MVRTNTTSGWFNSTSGCICSNQNALTLQLTSFCCHCTTDGEMKTFFVSSKQLKFIFYFPMLTFFLFSTFNTVVTYSCFFSFYFLFLYIILFFPTIVILALFMTNYSYYDVINCKSNKTLICHPKQSVIRFWFFIGGKSEFCS